jgi:hypothetical protein
MDVPQLENQAPADSPSHLKYVGDEIRRRVEEDHERTIIRAKSILAIDHCCYQFRFHVEFVVIIGPH